MEDTAQPLILLVEDEPIIAELLCEVLQSHGCRCVIAGSADAALRLLDTIRPELITLDLALPGISGRTLLQLIRADERLGDIPVIIVSAECVIEGQLRAASQGVVCKPFDVDELVATVQRVLAAGGSGGYVREIGGSSNSRSAPPAA